MTTAPTCATCRHWRTFDDHLPDHIKLCTANPPTHDNTGAGTWPRTEEDQGCGAYQPVARPVRIPDARSRVP